MNKHPDKEARTRMLKEAQSKSTRYNTDPAFSRTCTVDDWQGFSSSDKIRFVRLHEDAIKPTKANKSDAGFDLCALHGAIIEKHCHKLVKTGIAMEIPEGYVGLIWPRSGMAYKYGIDVFAGVIDSGYRGDIGVILYNSQYSNYNVEKGDRIAQLVLQKVEHFELIEASDLNKADRQESGFGSTGK